MPQSNFYYLAATIMSFNGTSHRQKLAHKPNYAASPSLIDTLEWCTCGSGHAIFDVKEEDEPFIAVLVGKVIDYELNANPNGTYLNDEFGTLEKAKYQFYTTRPIDPAFKEDFSHTYTLLDHLQNIVAKSHSKKDMLFNDVGGKLIHFTHNIFKERVCKLETTPQMYM